MASWALTFIFAIKALLLLMRPSSTADCLLSLGAHGKQNRPAERQHWRTDQSHRCRQISRRKICSAITLQSHAVQSRASYGATKTPPPKERHNKKYLTYIQANEQALPRRRDAAPKSKKCRLTLSQASSASTAHSPPRNKLKKAIPHILKCSKTQLNMRGLFLYIFTTQCLYIVIRQRVYFRLLSRFTIGV